jgi:hypothetical protein
MPSNMYCGFDKLELLDSSNEILWNFLSVPSAHVRLDGLDAMSHQYEY